MCIFKGSLSAARGFKPAFKGAINELRGRYASIF